MFGKNDSRALYAKHSVNLFHVLKKGIPKNTKPSVSLIKCSLFCLVKERGVWCQCQSLSGPDMSRESCRMGVKAQTVWEAIAVLRHEYIQASVHYRHKAKGVPVYSQRTTPFAQCLPCRRLFTSFEGMRDICNKN